MPKSHTKENFTWEKPCWDGSIISSSLNFLNLSSYRRLKKREFSWKIILFILFSRLFKRQEHLPIHVDVMSRPLLHLFGKLVYNGWAISLGGAASNFAYERRAFHVITPHCLKGLQNKLEICQGPSVQQVFQNTQISKRMWFYSILTCNWISKIFWEKYIGLRKVVKISMSSWIKVFKMDFYKCKATL